MFLRWLAEAVLFARLCGMAAPLLFRSSLSADGKPPEFAHSKHITVRFRGTLDFSDAAPKASPDVREGQGGDKERLRKFSAALLDYVAMEGFYLVTRLFKPLRHVLGHHDAAVLATGTAEGDGQIALPFFHVVRQQVEH